MFFLCASIILIPHIILYVLSTERKKIDMDVNGWKVRKQHSDYSKFIALNWVLLKYPEFRSLFYHRIGKLSVICRYLPGRTNLYLQTPSCRMGGAFYIGHGWGTVVNAREIGCNCMVGQNCTIGSRNKKEPILEDNVSVWAHAVVLGDITIGMNSNIGAGAVVVKSVLENSVVVPAKSCIIRQNGEKCNILL